MSKTSFFNRATLPKQYDSKNVNWEEEGDGDDSIRRMLLECVMTHSQDKITASGSHLDLGCGTGWLCASYVDRGLRSLGVDASSINIAGAVARYPQADFDQVDFINDHISGKYTLVTALMSFEHVGDVATMMKKVEHLLEDNGRFVLIHGDYDYFTKPRFDVQVSVENTEIDGQVATQTNYGGNFGVLYDVIRRKAVYRNAAESAGLTITNHDSLAVPEWLISERPKYAAQRAKPMFQVLVAQKDY